jgi:demethylmenaquinone methyltransferase / 2-methoxy-6-polyprenyl-1,4-benzoquinol methylase
MATPERVRSARMRATAESPSERTRHARRLFAGLPGRYDLMGRLWSFGQDPRWRRFLVSQVMVAQDGRVLDVATGTAAVAIELMHRTGARVIGLDQSEPMLREGIQRVAEAGLADRMSFVLGQAERLPFPDAAFDALTFTYLLRYVDDPAATLAGLARVVKPGGTMAALEFDIPSPVFRPFWYTYTRLVMPAVGRVVSRPWYEVGKFLGPSISSFYDHHPLAEQLLMWEAAGIEDLQVKEISLGGAVVIWGRKAAIDAR